MKLQLNKLGHAQAPKHGIDAIALDIARPQICRNAFFQVETLGRAGGIENTLNVHGITVKEK